MSGRRSNYHDLPEDVLDPRLVPADLLRSPGTWQPASSGIDPKALHQAHPDLRGDHDLLSSGRLADILLGRASLYADLPPVHLSAYLDGLRPAARRELEQHQLSALEHLASHGWRRFRTGRPLGKDLDRYQPLVEPPVPQEQVSKLPTPLVLVVVHSGDGEGAHKLKPEPGWQQCIHGRLNGLDSIWDQLKQLEGNPLVCFCHHSDQLAPPAAQVVAAAGLRHADAGLISSDESLQWSTQRSQPPGNPQFRMALTPWRLLSRGAIGGLVSIRLHHLLALELPQRRLCLHNLLVDLSLQLIERRAPMQHCSQVLLSRDQQANPSVPDVSSPRDRLAFSEAEHNELLWVCQHRAQSLLSAGGSIHSHPHWHGCVQMRWSPPPETVVSILIPFRDKVELTRVCVASIRRCAGSIPYELVLIDNGSCDEATAQWLDQQREQPDVTVLRLDCPFNYARLHNLARPHCRGTHLLLLNNDIELRSSEVLSTLLHPFAVQTTVAVGARLLYPDGSLQHQGVMLIKGERRCVLEPGKHLRDPAVIDSLTPLGVQEEFIAATAACLLIRAQDFDAIGGFDEDFAVVFNDVDLCLRLREGGGAVVVTPDVEIVHHESISRGKDQYGEALARHQLESGHLRRKHAALFASGDPLQSPMLHPHSTRFQPRMPGPVSTGSVRERLITSWSRRPWDRNPERPLILFAHFDPEGRVRADLIPLLNSYQEHGDVVFISASPRLRWRWRTLRQLRSVCQAILIRRNEGYDFGSWMTGLRWLERNRPMARSLILTNDSFWGPIGNLTGLFQKVAASDADVIGLTDDLMYEPHLQSAFLVFREPVLQSAVFQQFWRNLKIWPRKRDLVKQCEVGLPVALRNAGFCLESLYTKDANGNILHTAWRELIEAQDFPFLKVSLLRDNPTRQPIDDWEQVVGARNPALAQQIRDQLARRP